MLRSVYVCFADLLSSISSQHSESIHGLLGCCAVGHCSLAVATSAWEKSGQFNCFDDILIFNSASKLAAPSLVLKFAS